MDRSVAAEADDRGIGQAPARLQRALGRERRRIVQRGDEKLGLRLGGEKLADQRRHRRGVAQCIETDDPGRRLPPAKPVDEALDTLRDPVVPVAHRAHHDTDHVGCLPRARAELGERLAADATGRDVVGGIERRIADWIVDREDGNARLAERARDRLVGTGLVEILDEQIDAPPDGIAGIVQRRTAVAAVVVEDEVHRQSARREDEALADLAAGESCRAERRAGLLGEIGEGDRVPALVGARAERADDQYGDERQHECSPPARARTRRRHSRGHRHCFTGCRRSRQSCRSCRRPAAPSC